MNVQDLNVRLQSLDVDMKNAKHTINMLTEQLESTKAQFHVLSGHHHEVGYQIECAKKEEAQKLLIEQEEAAKMAAAQLEDDKKHGRTIRKD